ncbi:MAG: hypothetical protein IJN82_00590, partial [Clostridia bacterium]|nr:hypothetical protein [Clostridia bacterium]
MGKLHIVKRAAALLLSLLMLLGMYVNTSVAYVNAETPSLVNTFSPFKTALSDLVVSKKLEHPLGEDYEIPENITFDFEVDLGRSYADFTFDTTEETTVTADKNGVLSLTLKPGQSIGIEGIEVGTTATVTELPTELPGFSVKNDQKTVTATVNEQQAAIAEITNVYTPKSAKGGIVLAGEKLLTGRDWKDGDRFTVLLEMQEGEEWKNVAVREIVYDSENPAF